MKTNKNLLVLPILSMIVLLLGATFSFFNISAYSNEGAVGVTAAVVDIEVEVSPLYTGKDLIPMDDNLVMTGYNHNCVDDNQFGACHVYEISVINNGDGSEYSGTINFSINGIEHLNYLLLDEEDNVYVSGTPIVSGTDQSLGNSFALASNETKKFKLVVWLSNYEDEQDDEDGGGSYSALVTYASTYGTRITGTFSSNG